MSGKRQFARLGRQAVGFITLGLFNFIATYVLYLLLHLFLAYWLAYSMAFVAGIAFSLFANAWLVFHTTVTAASAARFTAVYLLSYLAGLAILVLLVDGLGIASRWAPLGVMALLVPMNFFGSRLVLAKPRS